MKRPITARYGDTLEQAATYAVLEYAREARVFKELGSSVSLEFDFHGLAIPMTAETTAEDLVREVSTELAERADLYETLAPTADAFIREQGGKMGESLYLAVPASIQCGQRWGNLALAQGDVNKLRHAFEFNGLQVPFNPWKQGEAERVLQVVEAHLAEQSADESAYFVSV